MTNPDISSDAQQQLAAAVSDALEKPQAAQGFLGGIPDLSKVGEFKDNVVNIIDTVLGAINTVQQYSWLLGKYAEPVQKFEDALTKVRGWVD